VLHHEKGRDIVHLFLYATHVGSLQGARMLILGTTPWGGKYRSWSDLPELFQLILCCFPYREAPERPAKENHPALVVGVLRDRDLPCWGLDVFFGTSSNLKLEERGNIDFIIQDAKAAQNMGLDRPTRFDVGRWIALPWCDDFFRQWRPFGELNAKYQESLIECLNRYQRNRGPKHVRYQPVPADRKWN
jgi:hypothetical protein